jgi:glycerophosphoryl diester phosphodiesterase
VAHRGGGEDGVSENSMSAFRAGVEAGADVLETDVQWTKATPDAPNGVPVLMHDATVNRTARCPV